MATKKEEITLERTYNVPLRKEYLKVKNWRRTEKAVTALRQFLAKHMKAKEVKIGKEANELLWQHGIRNPPHHIKVTATKDKEGIVKAELFGVKKEAPKKEQKKDKSAKKEPQPRNEEKKELSHQHTR